MRLRGFFVVIACAALVLVPGAATAPSQAVPLFGTVGPGFTITLADANSRPVTQLDPGTYDDHGARPLRRAQLPPLRPRRRRVHRRSRRRRRSPGRSRSARAATRPCATRTRRRCSQNVHRRQPAARDDAEPPRAGRDAEAARDGRPEEHDLAPERERQDAASRCQGRHLLDRRARPLEAAQLPSVGKGVNRKSTARRHRHADVEAEAREGDAPLLLRPAPKTRQGLGHRQLAAPARLDEPASRRRRRGSPPGGRARS